MAQTACPHCGNQNTAQASYCARCQRPLLIPSAARDTAPIHGMPPRRSTVAARPPGSRAAVANNATTDSDTVVTPRPNFASDEPTRVSGAPLPRLNQPTALSQADPKPDTEATRVTLVPQRPMRPPPASQLAQTPSAKATGLSPLPQQRPTQPSAASQAEQKSDVEATRLSPLLQRLTPRAASPAATSSADVLPAAYNEATVRATVPLGTPPRLRVPLMPPPVALNVNPNTGPATQPVRSQAPGSPLERTTILPPERGTMPPPERTTMPPIAAVVQHPQMQQGVAPAAQEEIGDFATHPKVQPTSLGRVAAALSLDAAILFGAMAAAAGTEMLLVGGSWPAERSGIEALAIWMHLYAYTALRVVACGGLFTLVHSTVGARHGRTLGRAVLGLTLVRNSGEKPTWNWALWHAGCSIAAALLFGAGIFWSIVDLRHRTWGNLLSRSAICID